MTSFFHTLGQRISDPARASRTSIQKALDQCTCGQSIFFRNSLCLACQSPLGYEPQRGSMLTLQPADQAGIWQAQNTGTQYRRCSNFETPAGCNWLLPAQTDGDLCIACRLNRAIPDLSIPGNDRRWAKLETAKRRLVAQLLTLRLPVISRMDDADHGLAFDFLATTADGEQPITGHAGGLITLNAEEADDARREQVRVQMHEPYRTLLGHFRHEVGHYYWDLLVADGPWLEAFRQVFGDERSDYAAALQWHYEQGAPADWQSSFISAYATMHPWEDWAETWAHYLHMMDTLDTALSLGMRAGDIELDFQPFTRETLHAPDEPQADAFLVFVNAWIELAAMLNELSRSMGQPDLYPFVLPAAVIGKLHLVHRVVLAAGSTSSG